MDDYGARAVWQAWYDGMMMQGRFVSPERRSWETLTLLDRELDRYIAERIRVALAASEASQRALREALEEIAGWGDIHAARVARTVLAATAAPPQADDCCEDQRRWREAKPLPTTESLTRSDPGVTGWTGESDEQAATP